MSETKWRIRSLNLELTFSAVQAICAIIVTSMAVWAAFGTDIPKLLVDQLRIDVTTAKRQVLTLQDEKSTLEQQLQNARSSLIKVSEQSEEVRAALSKNRESLQAVNLELAAARLERQQYLQLVKRRLSKTIIEHLDIQLENALAIADYIARYPEFDAWAKQQSEFNVYYWPRLQEALETGDEQAHEKAFFSWKSGVYSWGLSQIPELWHTILTVEVIQREPANMSSDSEKWVIRHGGDWENNYQRVIDLFPTEILVLTESYKIEGSSGRQFLESALKHADFGILNDQQKRQIRFIIDDFIQLHSFDLTTPIDAIDLARSFDPAKSIERAQDTIERIERVQSLVPILERTLDSWEPS